MKKLMSVLLIALSVTGKAQMTGDDTRPQTSRLPYVEVKPACYLRQLYQHEMQDIAARPRETIVLERIPNTFKFTRAEIIAIPATYTRDIAAFAPTVYQVRRGSDLVVAGSRPHDILYVIDGMQIPRN